MTSENKKTYSNTDREVRSGCPIANGLDVIGDRWSILIIRDLMLTNRNEFGHFLKSAEGISTNILTERLERLQCYGIIAKLPHPTHGKKFIYQLTSKGREFAPVLMELALWSEKMFPSTSIPKPLKKMIREDPEGLYKRIKNGEVIFELKL